jgi:hypothetical protein
MNGNKEFPLCTNNGRNPTAPGTNFKMNHEQENQVLTHLRGQNLAANCPPGISFNESPHKNHVFSIKVLSVLSPMAQSGGFLSTALLFSQRKTP